MRLGAWAPGLLLQMGVLQAENSNQRTGYISDDRAHHTEKAGRSENSATEQETHHSTNDPTQTTSSSLAQSCSPRALAPNLGTGIFIMRFGPSVNVPPDHKMQ
jgi:hypothetical protein